VELVNTEYFVFAAFLRYLYTDQLKAPLHHIKKVEILAKVYGLERLEILCRRLLTFKFQKVHYVPPSTLSLDLHNALSNTDIPSDVTFTLSDNTTINAHKIILTARSDYFRTTFEGSFKESGLTQVNVREIDRNIFLELLRFMYTNDISEQDDLIVDILEASGRFLLDDLKQKIEKQLESQIDTENVLDLLTISEATHTPKLRKACTLFLVDNLKNVKNIQLLNDHKFNSVSVIKRIEFLYKKKYDPDFNFHEYFRHLRQITSENNNHNNVH